MAVGSRDVAAPHGRDAARGEATPATEAEAAELLELTDALCELDREFRVVRVNRRQEELTGLARSATVGRLHWELWPDSAHPDSPFWREYHRCMRDRVPVQFEAPFVPLERWFSVAAHPLSTGGIAVFFRDVTEQRRSEEERKRMEQTLRESERRERLRVDELQTVLDTVPAAVWISRDPGGERIDSNRFGAELLRRPAGTNVSLTGPEPRALGFVVQREGAVVPAEELPVQKAARTGIAVRGFEEDLVFEDGIVRHLYGSVAPILDEAGRPRGAVGAFLDVTERRRAEREAERAHERLRVAQERLVETLRFAGAGTWEWDLSTETWHWSPESYELFGLEGHEVPNQALFERLVEPHDLAQIFADLRRMVDGDTDDYRHEFRVRHPRRGERWILGVGRIDRAARRIRGLNLDVTDRKQAELQLQDSRDRLSLALAAGGVGIWQWTVATGEVRWTPEAYAIMGRREGEYPCTGDAFFDLVHPADLPELRQRVRAALEQNAPYVHVFRIRLPDGTSRWVANTGRVVRDREGKPVTMIGTVRDVTEERASDAALREADRRKTEFLAVLSHELRNPLAPIRNSVALLDRAAPGSDAAHRAREVLRRQTEQLGRLVDDLLELSRIAHGKIAMELARLDARDVARQAYADARGQFDERGVELRLADAPRPLWVDGDAVRLAQLLGNLLNNALKFTPPRGRVVLHVGERDGACELRVQDSGCGLEPSDRERIFEPFYQAERTRGGQAGLGIGLALVHEVARRHGGAVRAESAGVGRGTEVVVRLPLAAAPADRAAAAAGGRAAAGISIYVVDDNEDAATSLADLLALGGNRVRTFGTGGAGVEAVVADPPDVLICDVGLPDMSGHDVIRAVRRARGAERVFAIALTGYAHPRDREASLAAGFDAHLPKPTAFDDLARLVGERVCGGVGGVTPPVGRAAAGAAAAQP